MSDSEGGKKYDHWNRLKNKMSQLLGREFWEEIKPYVASPHPCVDRFETKEKVIVLLELPGLKKADRDQLEMTLDGSVLTIKGVLTREKPEAEGQWLETERFSGPFERQLTLPVQYRYDRVLASYIRGLLQIEAYKDTDVSQQNVHWKTVDDDLPDDLSLG